MLFRIEENLPLLAPCMKTTRDAVGGFPSSAKGLNSAEISSVFFSPYGSCFDHFYACLTLGLLKISFDEPFVMNTDRSEEFLGVGYGLQIKNIIPLKVLKELLKSDRIGLLAVAVKVIFLLIRINPLNIVALEKFEVIQSLLNCFVAIVSYGNSMSNFSVRHDSTDGVDSTSPSPRPSSFLPVDLMQRESSGDADRFSEAMEDESNVNIWFMDLLQEMLQIFQLISTFYSKRDDSVLACIILVLLQAWIPVVQSDSVLQSEGKDYFRCANCEVELASLECICERYNDNYFHHSIGTFLIFFWCCNS